MSYFGFGGAQPRSDREFYEKAYLRKGLPEWDAKWHALSPTARSAFLNEVKGPVKSQARQVQPSVPADKFPPEALKELTAAGFVKVQPGRKTKEGDRVFAIDGLYDFATRLRTLRRYHLLDEKAPGEFTAYVSYCYYNSETWSTLVGILQKVGITDLRSPENVVERYVQNHRWPGWIAEQQKDPYVGKVLKVIREAVAPVPITDLPARIPKSDPKLVRAAVDTLVGHMVLVEDFRGDDLELVVGLLPTVRRELEKASRPRERPPLVVCQVPAELGPDASVIVNDLRAYLLEIASDPPRLRQDRMLFQKEAERFLDVLEPLPDWLTKFMKWEPEARINQAHNWALSLAHIKEKVAGKEIRLHVSPKGESWLSSTLAEQYTEVYNLLRAEAKRDEQYQPGRAFLYEGQNPYDSSGVADTRFLGVNVSVQVSKKGQPSSYYYYRDFKPEDQQALRESLYKALDALPVGVFHPFNGLLGHLAFGPNNPLHEGREMAAMTVYLSGRPVPPFEEERERAAQSALGAFFAARLIPLGCVQTAVNEQQHVCVARTARLDAYFGRKGAKIDLGIGSDGESRVVVQPDFSVIVIGLNPAPAAELAPFCERTTKNVGSGAVVLKLTRDSVVKAVGRGLKPAEILNRLKRHASNEVPANVLREVQDWCGWVRTVFPSVVTVLRCEDREAADRAAAALGKQSERLGPTMVALLQGRLTPAERAKLLTQGVIVATDAASEAQKPKLKKKKVKRRSYYDDW